MCGCNRAVLEQYFGYQVQDSGTEKAIAALGVSRTNPIYVPTNPNINGVEMDLGFNGYRFSLDVKSVVPIFDGDRYDGIFPVGEQPRIASPYPYQIGLVL